MPSEIKLYLQINQFHQKTALLGLVRLYMSIEDVGLVVLVETDPALLHDARRRRWPRDRRGLLLKLTHVDETRRPPDGPHNSSLWGLPASRCPWVTGSEIALIGMSLLGFITQF